MTHLIVLAQAAPAPQGGGMGSLLWPMAIIFGIFYFLVIRPESKKNRQRQNMIAGVKKHDRVITTGGMFGTVVTVEDDIVTIQIDENSKTRVKFTKAAITQIIERKEADGEKAS